MKTPIIAAVATMLAAGAAAGAEVPDQNACPAIAYQDAARRLDDAAFALTDRRGGRSPAEMRAHAEFVMGVANCLRQADDEHRAYIRSLITGQSRIGTEP